MAGLLHRPESRNETVRRLILLQCRAFGNERDATISRDLRYAEAEAKKVIDEALVDLLKQIASKCMASCDLNRYADRKNPCIFIYNLASLPSMRSRHLYADAAALKDTKLLEMVCTNRAELRVMMHITIMNIRWEHLEKQTELRNVFQGAIREAVATCLGHGVAPECVTVDFWGGSVVPVTVTPLDGMDASELCEVMATSATVAALSTALHGRLLSLRGLDALASGDVFVGEIRQPPALVSDRTEAIFEVCARGAWLEQNTRDWDSAQGGALTGAALGYKHSMEEDQRIVDRCSRLMGFDS